MASEIEVEAKPLRTPDKCDHKRPEILKMIDEQHFVEIESPGEQEGWLFKSGLSIQFAAYESETNVFLAAHGNTNSVMMSRVMGELTVWVVLAGSKEERKALVDVIRAKFDEAQMTIRE